MRCGIAGERLVSQDAMLKSAGCGQTAATNAASASAATSCGLGALRSPDGVDGRFGSALHGTQLKSLLATF